MADIIDFSTLHSGGSTPPVPSGLVGVGGDALSGAGRAMAGEVIGAIGGDAVETDAPDDGAFEHPVPKAGEQVRYAYAAEAGAKDVAGRLAIELATHADGEAQLTVTAQPADVTPLVQEARTNLARSVGADVRDLAVMEQVKSALGQEAYDQFVASYVQRTLLQHAIVRTGLATFLSPSLPNPKAVEDGKPYSFSASVLLKPHAELTSYEPVEFEFPEQREVDSKDVTEYLDRMADQLGTYEDDYTRTEAADGDVVTISTQATYDDGRPFATLTRANFPYQVGSGMLPEELDRALAGMPVHDTRDVSVSLPMTDDDGNVAYSMISVRLTLHGVQRKVPAVINDAWVMQNAPQAGTLLGLRGQIRDALEKDAKAAYHDEMAARASEALSARLATEPGEAYVDRMRAQLTDQFTLSLANQGIDVQSYMARPDFDADAFTQKMTDEARDQLRTSMAVDALADHMNVKPSEDAMNQVVAAMAPGNERQALRELKESGQIAQVEAMARRLQASEWLVNTAKDTRGPKLQLV